MSPTISFDDFQKLDIRVGTIIKVFDFPNARKPAYQLTIDFDALGIQKCSAQITDLYTKDDLINRQIIAIVNFKPKQIANFISECLVLGVANEQNEIVLLKLDKQTINGSTIS